MDKLYFLILLCCFICNNLAEHNQSRNNFYLEVLPEHEILSNISERVSKLLEDQDQRFDTRMTEFENRIQNMLDSFKSYLTQIIRADATRENDLVTNNLEQSPDEQTCRDLNNTIVPEGNSFHPYIADACIFCICRGGAPAECGTVMCAQPTCREFSKVTGKCCEYQCQNIEEEALPVIENQPQATTTAAVTSRPIVNTIPAETTTTTKTLNDGSCKSWNNTHINEGEVYSPRKEYPCFQCSCEGGYAVNCFSVNCLRPECENLIEIEDACCEFTCLPDQEINEIQQIPTEGTCNDWNGTNIIDGQVYSPSKGDPCFQCTCDSGFPTNCYSVNCLRPECENFIQIEGVCCDFTCIQEQGINEIQHIPTEGKCTNWNGTTIMVGEIFAPDKDDLCIQCTCENGLAVKCNSVSCFRPECENFKWIEGVCCDFICLPGPEINDIQQDSADGICTDWNGTNIIDGETYSPDKENPCLKCTCESGFPIKCLSVKCSPEECKNVTQIKDKCCEISCLPDASINEIEFDETGRCKDLNNTIIEEGETYHPYRDDPCIFCTCGGGNPVLCGSEQCAKPSCPIYTQILGTCCDYICHEERTGETVNLDTPDHQLYFCGETECRLEYHWIEEHETRCNISIGIKTVVRDGMIFYSKDSISSNYEMLWMSDGKLVLSFNLGSGVIDVASQERYNDDQWHTVMIEINGNIGRLFVNGEEVNFGISPGDAIFLNAPHVYYIGAVPSETIPATPNFSRRTKPFLGCLRQFHHNGRSVGPPTVAMETEPCFTFP